MASASGNNILIVTSNSRGSRLRMGLFWCDKCLWWLTLMPPQSLHRPQTWSFLACKQDQDASWTSAKGIWPWVRRTSRNTYIVPGKGTTREGKGEKEGSMGHWHPFAYDKLHQMQLCTCNSEGKGRNRPMKQIRLLHDQPLQESNTAKCQVRERKKHVKWMKCWLQWKTF